MMASTLPPHTPAMIPFHVDHSQDKRIYTTKICCGMTVEVDFENEELAPTVWLKSPNAYLLFGDALPKGALKPQIESDVLRVISQAKQQDEKVTAPRHPTQGGG